MNYDRAAMKLEVKQAMKQAKPHPMLVTLLYLVIVGIVASLISGLISFGSNTLFPGGAELSLDKMLAGVMREGPDYIWTYLSGVFTPQYLTQLIAMSVLTSAVISILTTIWNALMSAGYAGYCLDMIQGTKPGPGRIFCGFSRGGSVILAYILVGIFTFLWTMLFAIAYGVLVGIAFVIGANDSLTILGVLLMLAATGGYIFATIWVVLRYAMVPYAVIDPQNSLSAMDAIRTSKNLMKGRKGRYFVLQLSFFGWYLLEYLVMVVGAIIVAVLLITTVASYANDPLYLISLLVNAFVLSDFESITQLFGPSIVVVALCAVGIFILDLWLTPYRTGSSARFYIYAMGGQPSQPDLQGGQPSQSGPYSGQPIPPYGGQPGQPYGGQSGQPYGGQPGQPYGGQPGQPYGGQPGQPYGGQPGQPYGGQPGQPYGGYAQGSQTPRYGEGTYPQWGALQAPQAPADPVVEPLAPPVEPAAPQTPQAPVEPIAPQIPQASVEPIAPQVPQAPAYPVTEPFAPPAAPTAPQTPQAPVEPIAPQIPQASVEPIAPQIPQAPAYPAAESFAPPAAPAAPQFFQTPAYPAAESFAPPAAPTAPQFSQAPAYPAAEPFAPVVPVAPVFSAAEPPAAPAAPEAPEAVVDPMPAEGHEVPQFSPEAAGEVPDLPLDATIVYRKKPWESKGGQSEKPDGPSYPQY